MRVPAGRRAGACAVVAAALAAVGCTAPTDGPAATESPAAGAAIVVTVHDVVGIAGGGLAGVLYEGSEMLHARARGGFGVDVDSDPFSVTATVKQPGRESYGPFPYVGDETLLVSPGTYSLYVWADTTRLAQYGRWSPGLDSDDTDGIRGCSTTFEVGESDVRLSIDGVPLQPTNGADTPCMLD